MKILNILISIDQFNNLSKNFIDYLIDSGNFVSVLSKDENTEWSHGYSYNLNIIKEFNFTKYDWCIDLSLNSSKLWANNQIIFIILEKNSDFIFATTNSLQKIIQTKTYNSDYFLSKQYNTTNMLQQLTELFIDTIIELQRSSDDDELAPMYLDINNNLFDNFLLYLFKLEKLEKFYEENTNSDELVKFNEKVKIMTELSINASHVKNTIDFQASLKNIDFQVILICFLSLLNGRQNGIYSYQYGINPKSIDKFITFTDDLSVTELKKLINNKLYDITDSKFAYNILSLESANILLCYDNIDAMNNFLIMLRINAQCNSIELSFDSNCFFKDIGCYLKEIINHYVNRKNDDILCYDLITNIGVTHALSFVQDISSYTCNDDVTIISEFEKQVLLTPDNIALVCNEVHLSYADLNKICNQAAANLIDEYGVKINDLVTLCLERDEYMLIGIIAVLKAGATYVPIDPSYPDDRINYIIKDTKTKVLLVSKNLISKFDFKKIKSLFSVAVIEDLTLMKKENLNDGNLAHRCHSNDLAYVIYTSGTTGNPKGVMIEHGGVINMIRNQSNHFNLNKGIIKRNCLWYSSYVFDAHVSELYTCILNGHTIHLIDDVIRYDFSKLSKYINDNNISIATIPPALLSKDSLLSLETIVVAGDKTDKNIMDAYYNNNIQIINAYGPTEASVCVSLNTYNENGYNNIGCSINNIALYVLDKKLKPLPIGIAGELYIGGIGVSRGYLNLPDLTNKCFLKNPFQTNLEKEKNINNKFYKTGDLVIQNVTGEFKYIGRNDFQVKINGYRIEIGEIENTIQQFPLILQSIVLVQENSSGVKVLIAYYTSSDKIDEVLLEKYLLLHLPIYMMPRVFIKLQFFPINISGKIERKAIPKIDLSRGNNYQAPSNKVEVMLCEIWAEILGISYNRVGVNDDFFKLGGNSVAAIKIAQKIMQNGYNIAIKDIFTNKTIFLLSTNLLISQEKNNIINKNDYLVSKYNHLLSDKIEWVNIANNIQKGLLAYSLKNKSSDAYLVQIFFDYKSKIDIELLKKSWEIAVKKFSSLRLSFNWSYDGEILQFVHKHIDLNWNYYDITEYPISYKHRFIEKIVAKDRQELYALHLSPLFRLYLIKQTEDLYTFVFSNHHAIIDGWGINILFDFIHNTYHSLKLNETIEPLSSLFSYEKASKYCIDNYNLDLSYWKNKLIDVEPCNEINALSMKHIDSTLSFENNLEFNLEVTSGVFDALQQIVQSNSITLNAILQFVWHKLLNIFTQSSQTIVGTVVTGRNINFSGIDNTVGVFINTLPIVLNWNNDNSILDQIINLNNFIMEANDNSLVFLSDLQTTENLFNNLFVFQDVRKLLNSDYITVDNIKDIQKLDFPITVEVIHSTCGLNLKVRYDSNVFTKERIEYLIGYARHILYNTIENMDKNHSFLNVIPTSELVKLNNYQIGYSSNYQIESIPEMFESQAISFSNNIAVIDSATDSCYSYEQTMKDSEILAKYIIQLMNYNVMLKTKLIAVLSEKGYNHVFSTLAIMKSGCAYLPLNVDWPIARLDDILTEGEVKILLISEKQLQVLTSQNVFIDKYKILILEYILKDIKENYLIYKLDKVILPKVSITDTAYVIYTSGSTGTPKGVTISHKGAINTLLAVNEKYNITSNDKVLALSELSFDLSVYDIFGLLLVGGTVVFPEQEKLKNIVHWVDLIDKHNITIYNSAPQLCQLLIDELEHSSNKAYSLRLFLLSGDWIPVELPNRLKSYCRNSRVVSLGGATEGSIWSIWFEIHKVDSSWASIPYGLPMPNQQMYVLDDKLEFCPIGVIGEIYIGGFGVAINYWNDLNRTYKSFIEHKNLGKIYKTGDLGIWNSNGYMEFHGRNDTQVKINGYRIELGEIECCLNKYPEITMSTSIIKNMESNNKIIVCFYVSKYVQDNNKLMQYLELNLPFYMVPSAIIQLPYLPMTINGKIDKKSLLENNLIDLSVSIVEPKSEIEKTLQNIWSRLLNIPPSKISITDNFFKLGGNSISVISLVTSLSRDLNIQIDFSIVYKYATILTLAKFIANHVNNGSYNFINMVNTQQDLSKPMLILFHTARGSSEVYQEVVNKLTDYFDIYLVNSYNLSQFEDKSYITSLNELVDLYYVQLKNYIEKYENVIIGGWSFGGILAASIIKKLNKTNNCSLVLFDTYSPNVLEQLLGGMKLSSHMEDIYSSAIQKEVGKIHDSMYKDFIIDKLNLPCYLIKAMDADIFVQNNYARKIITKELFNGWENFFEDILSYPVYATHETLFDKTYSDKIISYMIKIYKKVTKQ